MSSGSGFLGADFLKSLGANLFLAGIRPHEPRGHVPVEVVDGVRVFGVGLGQLAGEDLRLLLEPGHPRGIDPGAAACVSYRRCHALVQWDLVGHVRPWIEVLRGRNAIHESRPHRRRHQVELVHRRRTEDLLDRSSHVDLRVVGVVGGSVLHGIRADDIAWGAMTVDVVDAVLCVVLSASPLSASCRTRYGTLCCRPYLHICSCKLRNDGPDAIIVRARSHYPGSTFRCRRLSTAAKARKPQVTRTSEEGSGTDDAAVASRRKGPAGVPTVQLVPLLVLTA
jgi:hypothetical protein